MPRYIDADALYNKLYPLDLVDKKTYAINAKVVAEAIAKSPTADVVPRAEFDKLEYTLLGVIHSVDKWLDGEELEQDEVNRAITMREKTLRIVENAKAEGARESLQEVRQLLLNMVLANSMGETYDLEGKFTELEKKYKGGGDTD